MRHAKRVGVIGTFVWDAIHGQPPHDEPVEGWGGITYALSGMDAALSDDWQMVPVMKVGGDRIDAARDFLATLEHVAADAILVEVPEKNNCSTLHYYDEEHRSERLSGGVPGWSWEDLRAHLQTANLDALHVNFLSGWELDLDTAQKLRQWFEGPIYADIHMMAWSVPKTGDRELAPIENAAAWCGCFDHLQMNEDEMAMMSPNARMLAAMAFAGGAEELLITLGKRGVIRFVPSVDEPQLFAPAMVREGPGVDPTGCGDVWGATYFARRLSGKSVTDAMAAANRAAGMNAVYRGVDGLAKHLNAQ